MDTKHLLTASVLALMSLLPAQVKATHFIEAKVIDKDYLMLHFRDGEVRYREENDELRAENCIFRRKNPSNGINCWKYSENALSLRIEN